MTEMVFVWILVGWLQSGTPVTIGVYAEEADCQADIKYVTEFAGYKSAECDKRAIQTEPMQKADPKD